MTNYNDGKWHMWHGGECPLHPLTVFEGVFLSRYAPPETKIRTSKHLMPECWTHDASKGNDLIIAFRVVEEHREPREFWIDPAEMLAYADDHGAGHIHVREVLE